MVTVYNSSKTATQFHLCDEFVRLLIGPIGSGKSVACIMELLARAYAQKPNPKGVRKTRWAIIRNSYRELQDTTLNTFFDWVPKDLGNFKTIDMKYVLKGSLDDGTQIEMEVLFRALDKPKDVKKLLSLELTGAFINEAREIPKAILDMLVGRVGRYPNARDGGPTWFGVFMDTNPPDEDHWMYRLFEEDLPNNHAVFHQPSGVSAQAENVENLPPNYYINMQAGKDPEWIKVYVHGEYGFVSDGKPIYPEFKDHIHVHHEQIFVLDKANLFVGIDFGLTPAATIMQQDPADGQWQVIDELATEDMGAKRFGTMLGKLLRAKYRGHAVYITGDPAGEQRSQTDEQTPFDILSSVGVMASPAYTNDFTIRRETVANMLSTLTPMGRPSLVVSPNCRALRKGMNGGYKYRRMQVVGEDRFKETPDKGIYSHVCESLQYNALGAGEDSQILGDFEVGNVPNLDYAVI